MWHYKDGKLDREAHKLFDEKQIFPTEGVLLVI